jgi:hypothetical protein
MESADEVSSKMKMMYKMMYQHMERCAEKIASAGTYTGTVGTLTPTARFTEDRKVPSVTRYTIDETIVSISFKPSQQEEEAYKAWQRRMKMNNTSSQKSQVSEDTDA